MYIWTCKMNKTQQHRETSVRNQNNKKIPKYKQRKTWIEEVRLATDKIAVTRRSE